MEMYNLFKMLQVSFQSRTINQNIIEVNNNNFTNVRLQHIVNQSQESARCIGKLEWHHQPLIQALSYLEGCLLLIFRLNAQLMVVTLQVDLRKDFDLSISSNLGIENWYSIVIRLIALLSMHMRHEPSFF